MKRLLPFLILATVALIGCEKKEEELNTQPLSDYYPMQVGKYVTYNLDSTVFINFGRVKIVRSYQVRFTVDAAITDNLQRPAWRVHRDIRTDDTQPWTPNGTFMVVPTQNTVEFIENNLRFVKLHQPIRNNYSWKGNSHIDTYTPSSGLRYLDDWDYIYRDVGMNENYNGVSYKTITVHQRDEVIGIPTDPQSYSEVNYSLEKYAEGVGLVYKSFLHTEYQPEVGMPSGYFVDGSYGVELTMIDHN